MKLSLRKPKVFEPATNHNIAMMIELDKRNRHSPPVEFEVYDETPCPDGKGTHVWTRVYSLRVEHVDPKEEL